MKYMMMEVEELVIVRKHSTNENFCILYLLMKKYIFAYVVDET